MDKYEYKVRAEEIHNLIAEGEFAEAVEIADTIDWRRVKSIKTLCTISDLYKINRRYQESKEILLMAYERYPGGRLIVYSLCELSIKLEEYVQAIEYYKEYVTLAPKDTSRYILQYRLYEAQDVSLEERISVLEEFKRKDYREKWGYELAYLYHRMGLASKCIDECDELIVTFGEGRYVIKAMELKMLHEPLGATQQLKYDEWINDRDGAIKAERPEIPVSDSISDVEGSTDSHDLVGAPTTELPQEIDIEVKTVDVGQYNTTNLQEALAESMKDLWGTEESSEIVPSSPEEDVEDNTIFGTGPMAGPRFAADPESFNVDTWENTGDLPLAVEAPTVEEQPIEEEQIEAVDIPISSGMSEYRIAGYNDDILSEETKRIPTESIVDYLETQRLMAQMQSSTASMQASNEQAELIPGAVTGQLETIGNRSTNYDQMLAQEYDGQIRLAISEGDQIEKQITGQLSIDDILKGWEDAKKENEIKREEEVRQRILQHTGSLFDEFDEETRKSLLEQLEKAFLDAIIKESKEDLVQSEELNKRIRKEAVRAVEVLSRENLIDVPDELVEDALYADDANDNEVSADESEDNMNTDQTDSEVSESDEESEEEVGVDTESEADETADSVEDNAGITSEDDEIDEGELESDNTIESERDVYSEETDSEDVEVEETDTEEAGDDIDSATEETDMEEDSDVAEDEKDGEESAEVKAVREALAEDEAEESSRAQNEDTSSDGYDGNREMSEEEIGLFTTFFTRKSTKRQIIYALDNMSMAAYTGNVIVTGEEGVGTIDLAKNLIRQMQSMDGNCTGPIAKIVGKDLNSKDLNATFEKIRNGVLLIEKARGLKKSTVNNLLKILENENLGVLVILEDTAEGIDRIISAIPKLADMFNVRIDLKALDDKALVNYAREYAYSQEYSIDEYALLALHTRIAEMQTSDHQVTLSEVRDLVDDAIYFASKKTIGHFFDIVSHKRYDKEDMIVLREKDFMHY